MTIKPLFVPLKSKYFDAFGNGTKRYEYRPYGKRWNADTLLIGRKVILSRGYSGDRILAEIVDWTKTKRLLKQFIECYADKHDTMVSIELRIL